MSATPQLPPVAKLEQKTVVDLIAKGNRIDERGHDSYRPITIQTGIIEKANGSAQIFLGKTRVLVGIKVETGEPFPDTPEEGVLTVNAELVPLAHPSFEPGPPDENAIELARVIDRGISLGLLLWLALLRSHPVVQVRRMGEPGGQVPRLL